MKATRLRRAFDDVSRTLPVSPWAGGELTPIDIMGLADDDHRPMTRAEAMSVPAVARARHLICGTIAGLPLRAERDGAPVDDQPPWLYRTNTPQAPSARLRNTSDDLLFHGESLWLADRGVEGLRYVEHVPHGAWQPADDGSWVVAGTRRDGAYPPEAGIYFCGPHEGILRFGGPTIRGASRTMAAAVDVAEHPMRLEIHDTGSYPLTDAEQRQLVSDARAAMADGGGVLYTTPGVESKLHSVDAGAMMVDAREAFAVDIARLVGIPSAMVDAHARGATMTYSTTADVIASFLHMGLTMYMKAITERLSLDDVTPRGTEVRFSLDDVLGPDALTRPTPEQP